MTALVGVDPQLADNPRTTRNTPATIPISQRRRDVFPPAQPSNANPETGSNKAYSGRPPRCSSVIVVTRCVVWIFSFEDCGPLLRLLNEAGVKASVAPVGNVEVTASDTVFGIAPVGVICTL